MSAKDEAAEQEEGTIRIPVAKFIDSVEEYLSSEFSLGHPAQSPLIWGEPMS